MARVTNTATFWLMSILCSTVTLFTSCTDPVVIDIPPDPNRAHFSSIDAPTILCTERSGNLGVTVSIVVGQPLNEVHDCVIDLFVDYGLGGEMTAWLRQSFTRDTTIFFSFPGLTFQRYFIVVGLYNYISIGRPQYPYKTSDTIYVGVDVPGCDSLDRYLTVQYDCQEGANIISDQSYLRIYDRFLPAHTTVNIEPDRVDLTWRTFFNSSELHDFIIDNYYDNSDSTEKLYLASIAEYVLRDPTAMALSFGDLTSLQLGTPYSFTTVFYQYTYGEYSESPYNFSDGELNTLFDYTMIHELGHTRGRLPHQQDSAAAHVSGVSCLMDATPPVDPSTNHLYQGNRTVFCDSCVARLQKVTW